MHRIRTADRVVVVSVDGLRPDAMGRGTPTLDRLLREGTYSTHAYTIHRSVTLPSHASMLTGVGIEKHGLGFNYLHPEQRRVAFPTVFHAADQAGLETSMFVAKQKLEQLIQGNEIRRWEVGGAFCGTINRDAVPHLGTVRDGVHFLHYADPDSAGHRDGWMSEPYFEAVRRADRCLAEIVRDLEDRGDLGRTLLLVTADHGGHGHTHGSSSREDRAIPWIAWGGPVSPARLERVVHTVDTAATVLAALGLSGPPGMEGQPVLESLSQ
jgi:arylsulfatase A-like enzyme